MVACALAKRPSLLILDEPTSGLDGANMHRLAAAIERQAHQERSVLLITHDLELLAGMGRQALRLPLVSPEHIEIPQAGTPAREQHGNTPERQLNTKLHRPSGVKEAAMTTANGNTLADKVAALLGGPPAAGKGLSGVACADGCQRSPRCCPRPAGWGHGSSGEGDHAARGAKAAGSAAAPAAACEQYGAGV